MKSEEDLAIIRTYPKKIEISYFNPETEIETKEKILEHELPLSLSQNFMLGVRDSNSKYLMRIDKDDFCSGFKEGTNCLKFFLDEAAVSPTYLLIKNNRHIKDVYDPQGAGIIYKRDAFMDVGGYDESLNIQADLDFYIRTISSKCTA